MPDHDPVALHGGTGSWRHGDAEIVVPVLGCAGSMGATTMALALATAATASHVASQVRVVECGSAATSGLAAASTAELGLHPSGWRQGERDHVLLQRLGHALTNPVHLPIPIDITSDHVGDGPSSVRATACGSAQDPTQPKLTVLDVSLPVDQLLSTDCWLREQVLRAPALVVVTWATVRGLRRLEGTLDLLGRALDSAHHGGEGPGGGLGGGPGDETGGDGTASAFTQDITAAVIGPTRKKWPKGVAHSAGARTRRLLDSDERLVTVPEDRGLAVRGLDSSALPPRMLQAGHLLLQRTFPLERARGGTGRRARTPRRPITSEPADHPPNAGASGTSRTPASRACSQESVAPNDPPNTPDHSPPGTSRVSEGANRA